MALTKVIRDGVQGISNSSDATALEITSSEDIVIKHNTNNAKLVFNDQSNSSNFFIQQIGSSGSPALRFFESTGDERMRIHNGGVLSVNQGIALGVGSNNTSSNVLDDYEEGTWTPSVGGNASYTTALGRYTKIGNHVLAQFDMTINVLGTGSVAAISGFPFAHENVMVASGSISYFSGVASNVYYLAFYVINNSTDAYITGITSAGGTIANTLATFQNSARVNGMVSYRSA